MIAERSSPLGLLSVVESPAIPFRHAPGLSLTAKAGPPPQLGVFTDGDGLTVINRFDGTFAKLAYLDQQTAALPFHLLGRPRTLILGAGGGADVLRALYHAARQVDAVEINPQMADLVRWDGAGFAGRLFQVPGVRLHIREARSFVEASGQRWDLIHVGLLDSFTASAAGVLALKESALYTVEAFEAYLARLEPGGILAITRWLRVPPRDSLKLFATAIAALEGLGVAAPGERLALIRSWNTATLMVKNGPLTAEDAAAIRRFAEARSVRRLLLSGHGARGSQPLQPLARTLFFTTERRPCWARGGNGSLRTTSSTSPRPPMTGPTSSASSSGACCPKSSPSGAGPG